MRRLLVLCCALLGAATCLVTSPPAGAAAPLPAVRGVHVVSSSTSVTLTWTVPADRRVSSVEIRGTNRPGVLPAGPRSNGHLARVGRGTHTFTVRRLTPGRRYGLSLFATDGHGHYAHRVALFATTSPGPVTGLQADESGRGARITWTDSRGTDHVVVRYARGPVAPARPGAGIRVPVARGRATSATIATLAAGARYSVSVFALDRAGRAATPAVTRFTTSPHPGRDAVVTGRVTDSAGSPLSGVQIGVVDADEFGTFATTSTGGDGRFSVATPATQVDLLLGGNDIRGGASDASGYQGQLRALTLRPGARADEGVIVLAAGAAVSLRVLDPSGGPAVGASVGVVPVQPYVSQRGAAGLYFALFGDSAVTAADGTAVIRGLDGDHALQACVSGTGGFVGTCARRTLVPRVGSVVAAGDLSVTRSSGTATISGVVRGGGRALPGVQVVAIAKDGHGFGSGTTAADGRFTLAGLTPGRYQVCAAPAMGQAGGTGYTQACRDSAAAPSTGLVLTEAAGAGVSGVVTGPHGHVVPGASVSVVRRSGNDQDYEEEFDDAGVTDRTGHFHAVGLEPGAVRICVSPVQSAVTATGLRGGCRSGSVRLTRGSVRLGLDVTVRAAAAVAGIVRNSAGAPLPGVQVSSETEDDDFEATTDKAGRYVLRGLSAGRHDLCLGVDDPDDPLQLSDDCEHRVATVTARTGATVRADITDRNDAALRVSVVDAGGAPVAAADVTVLGACGADDDCATVDLFDPTAEVDQAGDRVTNTDGATTFLGLRAGRYAVCAFGYYATTASGGSPTGYADGCSGHTLSLTVAATRTTSATLTLGPGGAYTGRVVDAAGAPLAGVYVHSSDSAATDYPDAALPGSRAYGDIAVPLVPGSDEITAADGTYSILGVQPGDGGVVCTSAGSVGAARGGFRDRCSGGQPGSRTGTTVPVAAGHTATVPDLVLDAGAGLAGTVRESAEGSGDVDVLVFAGHATDSQVADVSAGVDGAWRVTGLPAGSYTVCAEDDDSGVGQCWKSVAWDADNDAPPLSRATAVAATTGRTVTRIDFTLR